MAAQTAASFEKDRRDRRTQKGPSPVERHDGHSQNSPDADLQRLSEAVVAQWESLHARIEQCEAGDRDHIRELQARSAAI